MSQKKAVDEMKTNVSYSITFFFFRKSCRLWDNVEKYGRARQAKYDNIIRRMRFACCIPKATDTHSEYIILIASPWQQWLRERVSMLCHAQIACRVTFFFFFLNISIMLINPLNAELNPIRHLLALVGARHIVHVSRIRVKSLLSSYIIIIIPNYTSSWYDWI